MNATHHTPPAPSPSVANSESSENPEELFDAVGAAFSRLRRRTNKSLGGNDVAKKDLTRNLVINVVDEAREEITVGGVAEQLNVDPSVASRMVTDCIDAGYLARAASQADGRRTVLHLTDQGVQLRNSFRSLQRASFEEITAAWPDSERLEFARLLVKYAEDSSGQG